MPVCTGSTRVAVAPRPAIAVPVRCAEAATLVADHACHGAGKAAKFLGKLGHKLARNVNREAGDASFGRTAADFGAAHQLPRPTSHIICCCSHT